jgi:O-antigen/teichoic acid export membrane protein
MTRARLALNAFFGFIAAKVISTCASMPRARWLALNALFLLASNIVSKIILFAGSIFLFQYLDPNQESTYYLITAFGLIVATNFQDGMVQVSIRRIATDIENGPRHLGTLYLASLLLAFVLILIGIPAALIYGHFQIADPVVRGQFVMGVAGLTGAYLVGYGYAVAGAGFKAYERLYLESILLVIQAILNALVYWFGATHAWPLPWFFFGLLLTNAFHSVLSHIVLAAFVVRARFHVDTSEAWSVFRESLGLGYATLLRTIQDRVHVFFITSIAGIDMNTQFASPNNFLTQLKFVPASVRPALFPTLARKAQLPTDEFERYSTALAKFLYLVGLPLMILFTIAREQILPLFTTLGPEFHEKYAMALKVYPLVALAVALSFPSQVMRSVFVSIRKPHYEFYTVLTGVAVLAVLDFILIRKYGVIGAGYASVVGEAVILTYGLWLLHRVGRGLNATALFVLPTLCGIITYLLSGYLYGIHWWLGVISVLVVFPILLIAMRVISPTEWAIAREVIGRRKPADPVK